MDSHLRTVIKALTYRAAGVVITTSVAWAVTGRASYAAAIGLGDTVLKLVAFYGHERLWLRVRFGQAQPAPRASGAET